MLLRIVAMAIICTHQAGLAPTRLASIGRKARKPPFDENGLPNLRMPNTRNWYRLQRKQRTFPMLSGGAGFSRAFAVIAFNAIAP